MPSTLKAWIDQVVRGGKTFSFRDGELIGLAKDKPVYVAMARAVDYSAGGPNAAADFQEPYLRHIFSFIGIRDVRFVAHVHQHNDALNQQQLDALKREVTVTITRSDEVAA